MKEKKTHAKVEGVDTNEVLQQVVALAQNAQSGEATGLADIVKLQKQMAEMVKAMKVNKSTEKQATLDMTQPKQ